LQKSHASVRLMSKKVPIIFLWCGKIFEAHGDENGTFRFYFYNKESVTC